MCKTFIYIIALTISIIGWSLVTPIFEFPDEQAHIESVEFLAMNGRMPAGEEKDMSKEMYETQNYLGVLRNNVGINKVTYHPEYRVEYSSTLNGIHEDAIKSLNNESSRSSYVAKEAARYPRLYYDYIGLWYRAVEMHNLIDRTFVMRIGGILLAVAMAVVILSLGKLLFNSKQYAIILSLLVMLQPMHSFLLAGINSDNLHNLLFSGLILCGVYHLQNKPTFLSTLSTVIMLVLDILTKPQAFIAIPIVLLPYLPHLKKIKFSFNTKVIIWLYSLVGLVYLHPYYSPYLGLLTDSPNLSNASLVGFIQFSADKLLHQHIVWYWGVFKWLGVVLPPIYWQVANRLVIISAIGLAVYLWRVLKRQQLVVKPTLVMYLFFVSIFYALTIYWFDWNHVKNVGYSLGVQARYLFPTISAHMALFMIGILSFTNSQKVQGWILRGLGLFIIWMQLGGIWRLITSYYDVTSLQLFITQASQYKPAYAKGEWWYLWISLYVLSLVYLTWTMLTKPLGHTEPRVGESAPNSGKPQKYGRKKSKGIA